MSNLVIIRSKFYDQSGARVINLQVKSRYQGSQKENLAKTDSEGFFIFQASPNRTIEILAKPPNASDYTVFKTINSSSSDLVEIKLHKTISEYKQLDTNKNSRDNLVTTFFKVVDSQGKPMANFPVQTRPKGKSSYERFTDAKGIIEVLSSSYRDIELLVLTSNDEFVLKSSINSENGNQHPILIKLDEPYTKFVSNTHILLVDRDESDYVVEKTNVEMTFLDTGKKKVYSISNGKIPVTSMIGQRLQFTAFKPNGEPLQPVVYIAKRMKEQPLKLKLDVDITKDVTAQDEPIINKKLQDGKCACNRDITSDEFKQITTSSKASTFLKDLNDQFKKLNMNNCLEKAHFIAHTLHETASYSLLEEGLGGKPESSVYDGYKGRGLMQITYKKNYEQYGLAVNENFLGENKHRVAKEKKHAVGSAVWYWQHSKAGNLSPHALKNDLIATCALINGGYNGFDDREKYYKKAVSAFKIKTCKNLDNTVIANLDNYTSFENSYIHKNKSGESFGWGLWNDPQGGKKGKTKSSEEAKKGYTRFLNMSENTDFPFGYTTDKKGNKSSRKRYGYSAQAAKSFAEKRLKEL